MAVLNSDRYSDDGSCEPLNRYSDSRFHFRGPHRLRRLLKIVIILFLVGLLIFNFARFKSSARKGWAIGTKTPLNVRIYTHNVRYAHRRLSPNERPWKERKRHVASSIAFNANSRHGSVVCLQEVLLNQLNDILYHLNDKNSLSEWSYYGVGRLDGVAAGEFSPVLYRTDEWNLVENRTFWLSETPEYPSVGWDAAMERIVTMVTLESTASPAIKINVFNTHFDHKGELARRQSALLIAKKMKHHNEYPSFLCGDFNTQPTDDPYAVLLREGLKDSRTLIDPLYSYGHNYTFTGFDEELEGGTIIDYIWSPTYSRRKQAEQKNEDPTTSYDVEIAKFGIIHSYFNDFYISDHRPVCADYLIKKVK